MSCAATASPNNTGDVMSRPDDGSKDETIAEVFNNEGESEYRKGEFNYAIVCYTEGISVNCNDKNLNAELFTNRAKAHFNLGARTCVKLNLFEEAITWCDQGLAVSLN
ncbi:tetratricopeptide repeat protein 4-like isoform X2 [Orbicella faveolata]|uniref:tetratricopeptide repeat protein 4-like isoform X2 n=1 Tax=Orbicella faveolata TaxID=48498 RepID=UPI0009E2908E|nr:tetratricopeptide repeat protein 4-like isoform X2 [Orbicella faveolata]